MSLDYTQLLKDVALDLGKSLVAGAALNQIQVREKVKLGDSYLMKTASIGVSNYIASEAIDVVTGVKPLDILSGDGWQIVDNVLFYTGAAGLAAAVNLDGTTVSLARQLGVTDPNTAFMLSDAAVLTGSRVSRRVVDTLMPGSALAHPVYLLRQ